MGLGKKTVGYCSSASAAMSCAFCIRMPPCAGAARFCLAPRQANNRDGLRDGRRRGQMTASRRLSVRSICRKPRLADAEIKAKAFVSPGRDLITFLLVCADAADIRHENARLPRDIGADIP